MYVIRLPNGNLLVPESVASDGGSLMSDAYVEIGPDDVDYERLAADALTQDEFDERRRRWQEGDESLRRQFLDFVARHENLAADWDHIRRKIGIEAALPLRMKSHHRPYQSYYSDATRAMVAEIYAEDIAALDYSF